MASFFTDLPNEIVYPLRDEVIIKYQNADAYIYTKFHFNDWPSKCYKQNKKKK